MSKEVLTAKCVYCGKVVYSLYDKQLKHMIEEHEKYCSERLELSTEVIK